VPRFQAGSASVSVVPDLSIFHRVITRDLSKIQQLTIPVKPDLTGFRPAVRRELARVKTEPIRVPIIPELHRGALNRLRRSLQQESAATMKVDVDSRSAMRSLASLGSIGGAALAPLRTQAGAIAAGVLAIAPAAAQAGGALALLPALGVAAAAPIATLVIGAQGLGDAFKAFGTAAKESAANAQANAAAASAAAKQQEAAQKAVASAQRGVVSAERSLADAQKASQRAQEDLNRAREDAKDRIEDLNLSLRASVLDEEAAILALDKARERYNETNREGSEASAIERREADLAYRQAAVSLEDVRLRNTRLREETEAANRAGVEGSEEMIAARERVADAAQGEVQAYEGVQLAQQQLADAVADLGSIAAESSAQTTKLGEAMANLSPVAQGFVNQIHALAPAWRELRFDVQDRLLRGLGDSITQLADRQLPVLREGLGGVADLLNGGFRDALGVFSTASAAADFSTTFDNIHAAMAPVTAAMGPLSQAFIDLATVGSSFLPKMGKQVAGLATGFADWIAEARQSGELEAMIQRALDVFSQLGRIAGNVFESIDAIFSAGEGTGGGLLNMLESITQAIADLLGSAPAQEAMRAIFTAIGDVLSALLPIASQLITALLPIVPVIAAFITTLLPPFVAIMNALIPVVSMVVGVIGEALLFALEAIAPLFPVLVSAFQAVLGAIAPLIPVLVEMAFQLIPPLVGIIGALAPVVVSIVQAFLPLIPVIAELALSLIPPLLEIIEALLPIFSELAVIVADALMMALEALRPVLPVLIDAFLRIVEAVLPLLPLFLQIITALLPPLIDLFTAFVPILEVVAPIFADIVEAAAPIIQQFLEFLVPAIEKVGETIGWLRDAFDTAMDGIGSAWETLKAIVAAPVNFVIRTVLRDGLFSAWNWVLEKLGIDSWKIDLNANWLQGIPGYASGGLIRGPWQGPAADNVLARLNPKEFVQPVHAVDRYGVDFMEAVRTGRFPIEVARGYLPGLASGGQIATAMRKQFPDARTTSIYRPGDPGYHGRGMAVDFAGPSPAPNGSPFMAAMKRWWAETYGKGTSELIYNGLGNSVANLKNGSPLAYSRAVQDAHRNHVHVAVAGSLLGALGKVLHTSAAVSDPWYVDLWQSVTGAFDWLTDSIAKVGEMAGRFGEGPLTSWITELPGNLLDSMWDKVAGPVTDLFGGGDEQGGVLVRDTGGPLPPGYNMVYNGTGGTEWVLDRRETAAYLGAARGGGTPGGVTGFVNNGTVVTQDVPEFIRAQRRATRAALLQYGVAR
jgi:phage-related protein